MRRAHKSELQFICSMHIIARMSTRIAQPVIRAVGTADFAQACAFLVRFFAEEGFTTLASKIAANLRAMIDDPFCWTAMAWVGDEPVGITTISTNRGVE